MFVSTVPVEVVPGVAVPVSYALPLMYMVVPAEPVVPPVHSAIVNVQSSTGVQAAVKDAVPPACVMLVATTSPTITTVRVLPLSVTVTPLLFRSSVKSS